MDYSPYYYYWGKAHPSDGCGPGWHLFPYHCLDVAAVAAVWLGYSSHLRRVFFQACSQETWNVLRAWILFFVAAHDLGKIDIRFVLKAPEVAKVLNPLFMEGFPKPGFDHGQAGYAWFCEELIGEFQQTQEVLEEWMGAVAGHHGQIITNDHIEPPPAPRSVRNLDRDARQTWIEDLKALFLVPVGALDYDLLPLSPTLLAGFCSVCDWLGSNTDYFKYEDNPGIPLESYFNQSLTKAQMALEESGLLSVPLTEGGMEILFPNYIPRNMQTLVSELTLKPGLTIVEDATGSGKTELALALASRLLSERAADSVIIALPTQATANAMLPRLEEISATLFPEAGANLLLAHGKARFNTDFKALKRLGRAKTFQGKEEASVYCSQWLGSSRKRIFLGQIGVCTIDQVLMSVLPIRHRFVRSFGVQKSVLIVDEVHAYDSYMNALLEQVLKDQQRSGGSTILLSATLPSQRVKRLLQIWNPDAEPSLAYPLISYANSSEIQHHYSEQKAESRSVEIELEYTDKLLPNEDLMARMIQAAAEGARIAVICNLVADAQQVYAMLNARTDLPVDLFHSRFRFKDRQVKESDVLNTYGKKASREGGRILVATQVIEQSLDLDFDWMITQLCPLDLLFQRIGRLHRHIQVKERPIRFRKPMCLVLAPVQEDAEKPSYALHELIYGDKRLLWRTERWLEDNKQVHFPAAYREGIEWIYAEDALESESDYLTEQHKNYWKEVEASQYKALQMVANDTNPWRDTDANASRLTRDGEMSLNVVPVLAHNPQLLLNGETLNGLEDWERDELLSLNTIPVPDGWMRNLPPSKDGLFYLSLESDDTAWKGVFKQMTYIYHPETGLERIKHESSD